MLNILFYIHVEVIREGQNEAIIQIFPCTFPFQFSLAWQTRDAQSFDKHHRLATTFSDIA